MQGESRLSRVQPSGLSRVWTEGTRLRGGKRSWKEFPEYFGLFWLEKSKERQIIS